MTKTDQQIIEAVAAKIMGWTKGEEYTTFLGVGFVRWDNYDNQWIVGARRFDPLHDHNHAAVVRVKMRELGYRRSTRDHYRRGDGMIVVAYSDNTYIYRGVAILPFADELRAEILAAIEVVAKT